MEHGPAQSKALQVACHATLPPFNRSERFVVLQGHYLNLTNLAGFGFEFRGGFFWGGGGGASVLLNFRQNRQIGNAPIRFPS
jgi:hypothetical protein